MSSQRYERVRYRQPSFATQFVLHGSETYNANNHQVNAHDEESPINPQIPSSPPPSFRSRASSPTSRHATESAVDQNLADTFDADGSDSDEENDGDDRQRLMRGTPTSSSTEQLTTESTTAETPRPPVIERRPTHLPEFAPPRPTGRVYGGGSGSDGVFANLSAKPEAGEKTEEHPPVSIILPIFGKVRLTRSFRHTNKQQQMQHLLTGKPQFSHPGSAAQTRSTLRAYPSALSSPSFGTA
jgi:hypothetical protein